MSSRPSASPALRRADPAGVQRHSPDFGLKVRQLRLALGLTQHRLGEFADVSNTYVAHIENGSRVPSASTAKRLLAILADPPPAPSEKIRCESHFGCQTKLESRHAAAAKRVIFPAYALTRRAGAQVYLRDSAGHLLERPGELCAAARYLTVRLPSHS